MWEQESPWGWNRAVPWEQGLGERRGWARSQAEKALTLVESLPGRLERGGYQKAPARGVSQDG